MTPSRRTVLRWFVGVVATLVSGVELHMRGSLSRASDAQEPKRIVKGVSIKTWMNEWLSGKDAGSVLDFTPPPNSGRLCHRQAAGGS